MTPNLDCYGAGIAALADLVGDFELRSPMDVHGWYRREWEAIAEALGFPQELAAELAALRSVRDRVASTTQAGITAFGRWLAVQRPGVTDSQARVQETVLDQLVTLGRERGELWRIAADPTTLPTGACYDDGHGALHRAFYPDTAPGYFGDGWTGPPPRAESACGWTTPLVLHLGTFPWVYSSRLDGPAALRWTSGALQPALTAMRAMASLLEPAQNLRQDARQVAAIFQHFSAFTAPKIRDLPEFVSGRGATPGRLYRRGGLLHVHGGSLHTAGIGGPRGHLTAPAYNYVLRRFACFFGVRRAAIRALTALPADIQRLAATSADPCLRQHAEEVARAG